MVYMCILLLYGLYVYTTTVWFICVYYYCIRTTGSPFGVWWLGDECPDPYLYPYLYLFPSCTYFP